MTYEIAEEIIQRIIDCDQHMSIHVLRAIKTIVYSYVVDEDYHDMIAANGGVVPGCSGGALLNADDQVVGITVAVSVYGWNTFDSTSLAVPARYARALMVMEGIDE